ncbi:hypothetical protein AGDE_10595 [Angomonas deanei]|uniref:Alpha/beta hydrolase fold/Serine aminopeptidase, S33/X-Pro dipeptidyl-peptidase (S15 family)/Prolyl oligopeptidase family, putative n=1 Tax=Angomonas deanei TaxID=59799 RepID=A0A7G2CEH3_9TRYP|nr:hypothetical protein AGDE_10595 [Angomonas deanei]CAD2218270.1 alpha/beta hydrolase fold/Serine aminopeptidase, S33/X-Pro dipeptidyl-peptidase (S15 family)/Prolyl oligopeptidase family, putative [Angomonas deanei]|eukprot:EPY28011.1 hypothetical protein AGDE_10595 [Angomonas deanei]
MIKTKEIFKQLTSGPSFLDTMSDFIIRPQRSNYDLIDLGPSVFRIGDECKIRFQRTDIDLYNMRNMNIKCSWFRPLHQEGKLPCVVYCHANCGGRYDGLEALFLLTHGFTLFCFDFCGSGMSEGEYISLGFYERQDLATVTEYLYLQPDVDGIALWGRSMGAVTSVMYASKDRNIRCVICDSPFGSLRWLVHDLVEQNGGRTAKFIPSAVINNIVERIRKRIMRRAAFDIDDLNTVKYASQCQVPGLLFHGEEDDFVSYKQSMAVRDAFQASCIHMLVPGGHNDEREEEIHNLIVGYLRLYMIEKPQAERENPAPAPDPSSDR